MKKMIPEHAMLITGKYATQMDSTATRMDGTGTRWGGIGTHLGGSQNGKDVQMGGRDTHLYGRKLAYGTQMYIQIAADTAKNVWQLCHIATQLCGIRGIRDHPDKCVCDTNAYLAMFGRKLLHPFGWHMILWQDGCTDIGFKDRFCYQGGAAYE